MGSCASVWPPVSVSHGGNWAVTPGSSAQKSMLGTITYGSGKVLTYNGYPLHTYTGDSAAGQANGQGLSGIWFAMTPSGTAASTASGGSGSGSGNGGGSGGYG